MGAGGALVGQAEESGEEDTEAHQGLPLCVTEVREAAVHVLVEVLLLLELEAEDEVELVEADEEGDGEREALHHAVGEVQSVTLELEGEPRIKGGCNEISPDKIAKVTTRFR